MKTDRLFLLVFIALLGVQCDSKGQKSRAEMAAPRVAALVDPADFDLDYIMGKFDPARHPAFVTIDPKHANREGMYLRRDVYEAFQRMYEAALNDGVRLRIISATRNFGAQKGIWEAKWNGERLVENGENLARTTPEPVERALKILRYSSMPGTSRHHWGTDIDLNDLNNAYFDSGEGKKIYEWLCRHAPAYGFCQPYSPLGPERPHGYQEERWHWSYLPVSLPLTQLAAEQLRDDMISGFSGAETAARIKVVENYVLGINRDCR
jgi:D-alanyl-D-alanine carboxypeptidase